MLINYKNTLSIMKNTAIEEMKVGVSTLMQSAGQEAIIWSEALFTATGLPLVSTPDGATTQAHGIVRNADATLSAITAASNLPAQGVTVIAPGKPLPADVKLSDAGTPEQWAVLCDCYERAANALKASQIKNEPRPWW